jgi:hypothetical protein
MELAVRFYELSIVNLAVTSTAATEGNQWESQLHSNTAQINVVFYSPWDSLLSSPCEVAHEAARRQIRCATFWIP